MQTLAKPARLVNSPKSIKLYCADPPEGRFVLEDKSDRTSKSAPWSRNKAFSDLVAQSYRRISDRIPELLKQSEALCSCGNWLKFSTCAQGHSESKKLIGASFCRQRLCPMCQWRRSLLVAGQVRAVAHEASKDHSARFLLLTLTIKNCQPDEIADVYTRLTRSYSKLLKYKDVRSVVLGSFRAIETTISHGKGFHPHIHALVAVRPSYFKKGYLSHDKWRSLWAKSLGVNYAPMVNVKAVTAKRSLSGAVAESAKYAVKPSSLIDTEDWEFTDRNVETMHKLLKGRRAFAYSGLLKEIHNSLFKTSPEDPDADLLDVPMERCSCPVCGGDLAEIVFSWSRDRMQYLYNSANDRRWHESRY